MHQGRHLSRGVDLEEPLRPRLAQVYLDKVAVDALDLQQYPRALCVGASGHAVDGELLGR
jgi:hypothetical protein